MSHPTLTQRGAPASAANVTARLAAAAVAILLGVFILYGVGLAQPDALHNAAHDTRHSMAFPCH